MPTATQSSGEFWGVIALCAVLWLACILVNYRERMRRYRMAERATAALVNEVNGHTARRRKRFDGGGEAGQANM